MDGSGSDGGNATGCDGEKASAAEAVFSPPAYNSSASNGYAVAKGGPTNLSAIPPKDFVIVFFMFMLWMYSIMLIVKAWSKIHNLPESANSGSNMWRIVIEYLRGRRRNGGIAILHKIKTSAGGSQKRQQKAEDAEAAASEAAASEAAASEAAADRRQSKSSSSVASPPPPPPPPPSALPEEAARLVTRASVESEADGSSSRRRPPPPPRRPRPLSTAALSEDMAASDAFLQSLTSTHMADFHRAAADEDAEVAAATAAAARAKRYSYETVM